MTIGDQMAEPLMLHLGMTKKQATGASAELLTMVGIPNAKDRLTDYPHQFSGGMRQRVMIAMALVLRPADPDRRRTDHGPGCDHPGADHRAGQAPARRTGHGDHLDHP